MLAMDALEGIISRLHFNGICRHTNPSRLPQSPLTICGL